MKMLGIVTLTLAAVTLTLASLNSHGDPRRNVNSMHRNNDQGSMANCAKDKVPKLSVTWTPKAIQLGGWVTLDFEMTTAEDLSTGKVNVTVWLPQYPEPIFQREFGFTCDDIHKVLSLCPFRKQQVISIHRKLKVPNKYPVPAGTYKLRAEVYNTQAALFACLDGSITIKQSQQNIDYDDDYLG